MKVIAIVGLPGSGKTVVADWLRDAGCGYVRLGQLTLDIVKERGEEPGEASERPVREELRRQHGMAAFALLNFPKIDELRTHGHVVVDGLYSWEEYLAFREKYRADFMTLAVYAAPATRYRRLATRSYDKVRDPQMRHRAYTRESAESRDVSQIENLHQGGPIAMADGTLVNESTIQELREQFSRWRASFLGTKNRS